MVNERAVQLLHLGPFHQAESPRWIGGDRLVWVDMHARNLHEAVIDEGRARITRTTAWPDGIGCAAPLPDGQSLLVASGRSITLLSAGGGRRVVASLPPGGPFFNDGIVDPHGRF